MRERVMERRRYPSRKSADTNSSRWRRSGAAVAGAVDRRLGTFARRIGIGRLRE